MPIVERELTVRYKGWIPDAVPNITLRQAEGLAWIAQGLSNKQIAAKMGIKESTVRNMLYELYHRLGVQDRTEAVVVALTTGLITIEVTPIGGGNHAELAEKTALR